MLLAAREKDLGQPFLATARQVWQVGVGFHGAGHDLEVAHPAELIAAGVEDQRLCGLGRFDLRRRGELRDGRHERPHPEQLGGRAADHRRDLAFQDALAEPALDLLFAQGAGVQVLLQQRVVALRGSLDELAAILLDALLHVVGDGDLGPFPVGRRDEGLQVEEVDDAPEVLLGADRQVEGKRPRRQVLAQRRHRSIEVGVLLVQLADDHDARLARPVALLPRHLGPHRDLGVRPHHHDRAFGRPQAAQHLAREVEEPRSVEDVDLEAVVLDGAHPEVDRDLSLLFLRLEVHRRARLVGAAHSRDRPGGEQHRLGERRLAIVRVPQENDVPDLVGSVFSRHSIPHWNGCRSYEVKV